MLTRHLLFAAMIVGMVTTTSTFAQGRMESVPIAGIKWVPCDPKASPPDPCQMLYFRGDPEKEENYSMIKAPKGTKFGPHWHTSDEHLVVTKGTFVIGAEGQEKDLVLKAGDYAFIPARLVHWASFPEDGMFYLNVVGPDSYIDVKDKRP
jgi:quercetin dioxygenase-like cupin family protein